MARKRKHLVEVAKPKDTGELYQAVDVRTGLPVYLGRGVPFSDADRLARGLTESQYIKINKVESNENTANSAY